MKKDYGRLSLDMLYRLRTLIKQLPAHKEEMRLAILNKPQSLDNLLPQPVHWAEAYE